nr:hypothetical protein [Tanacetum cinerariifolium]
NSVSSDIVVESSIPFGTFLNAFTKEIVAYEKESDETHAVKKLDALCTPESFVTHFNFDTPGGIVSYIPKVYANVLLVKRNVYDSVDDCVVAYMKYAAEVGFVSSSICQRERHLTYLEQAFIVKAASVNIGATRAHHLLTGIKGSYFLVHGTMVDFKNFFRSVNYYIGDSDARMLIHKMENRKKHVSDFSFDYFVESAELSAIFWADEVSKYNYREFGDVVLFDATFKTNKYNMVFVLFTVIDNHKKCVTVAAAFIKAFGKAPSIVVTNQDGAMKNAIEVEFAGSKHRLCMWHITQKLPAKMDKAEEDDPVDLFFKKDGLYKVLRNIGDGSVVCSCQLFVRVGILYKYMFCVFKNANVEMIPQQYILRRWTKSLIPTALRNKRNKYDKPRLGAFVEKLKPLKKDVEADCLNPPSKNKTDNLEQFVGVLKPPVVEVKNPTIGSTKG